MNPVINSLLDTDLYKFTMWQAMLHQQPANEAEYRFHCRNTPAIPLASLKEQIDEQLDHLCTLSFQPDDLDYLAGLRYMKPDFVAFLRMFRFQRDYVATAIAGDRIKITARGPQVHVMAFEVFVLAIVNEVYFRAVANTQAKHSKYVKQGRALLAEKISYLNDFGPIVRPRRHPFQFFDFGTRRRFMRDWHDEVVCTLAKKVPHVFKGTSNVHLARKYGLAPIGTMAHEWLQLFQAVPGVQLRYSQRAALDAWVQEYRGDLGIALTDVIGMKAFLSDFDLFFSKLFDGVRHDSGDPVQWGERAIAHYEGLRIDPHTKRLVFSDGLDLVKCGELYRHFGDRIQVGFGVGTNLSNDVGVEPLSIVMKLVRCNGQPVAKLSDAPGKSMCDDPDFVRYLRKVFNVSTV